MKKYNLLLLATFCLVLFSCSDEVKDSKKDFPNDVTFNVEENSIDVEVPELQFVQMAAPFTARAYKYGTITLNAKKNSDGTHSGFALSNKNYRSFPWCNSKPHGSTTVQASVLKSAADTLLYSAYTGNRPNQLKNFVVARIDGEEAYFTIDQPRVVENVLVSNCTFNFLALSYGSTYSNKLDAASQTYVELNDDGSLAKVRNPNIPDPATGKYGIWFLPDYYNFSKGEGYVKMANNPNKTSSYLKVIATGYRNGSVTAKSEYYLAVRPGVAPAPADKWDLVQSFWASWDLSSLGEVDKVLFTMDSSEKNTDGSLKVAPYFCLDAIRLR